METIEKANEKRFIYHCHVCNATGPWEDRGSHKCDPPKFELREVPCEPLKSALFNLFKNEENLKDGDKDA